MSFPDEHCRLLLTSGESFATLGKHFYPGKLDPGIDRLEQKTFAVAVYPNGLETGLRRVLDEVERFETVQSVAHPAHQTVLQIPI
jgi:hypothetical protein